MANTVSGPYTETTWVDGTTAANQTRMSNLETQSKVALASLNPDLVTAGFILSGAQATRHNAYAATVLADAPLDYYRLDEASGTSVQDLGSLAQNGTTHAAPTQGVAGLLTGDPDTCYTFASASSQYVALPTSGLPTGAAAFSIEAWIKFAANPVTVATIVWLGASFPNKVAWVYLDTSGKLNFSTDSATVLTTTAALTTGVAHHVVATYDGANMRLYVDGALSVGPTAETFAITYSGGGANIGATATPNQFWNGQIDEVALYGAALSAARVTAHYTNGTTATTQVDIASGLAYLIESDGTLTRCVIGATSETTVSTNTTYYLYLQPDGTWYWSTSNAPAANSLAIAQVTTDGAGNVKAVSDLRSLNIPLFSGAAGRMSIPPISGPMSATGALTSLGGQASVGSFGAPVIVAQTINTHITNSTNTTVVTYTPGATGMYRVSMSIIVNGSVAAKPNAAVTWSDPIAGAGDVGSFVNATTLLNGGNSFTPPQGIATQPIIIYALAGQPIYLSYANSATNVSDYITAMVERLT